MSRNSGGTYSLPAGNPVVSGTLISSTVQNSTMNDIATALTQSIASTGVTTPTANLPMGNFRHTGVGSATAQACYASVTDVQNGTLVSLSAVAGADTITATAPFTVAAYAGGQAFRFLAVAPNTGSVTINISGLGAKSVTKSGNLTLGVGDIVAGQIVEIVYDGTQFQMLNARPAASTVVTLSAFTASGTYTPIAGMSYCVVHMVGGGAGGVQVASGNYGGGGGGSGEYATAVFSAADIGASKAVTIGAGGAVNSAGGTTSLGALLTAVGGQATLGLSFAGGLGGTGGTGSGLHVPGGSGENGSTSNAAPQAIGGSGGASFFGGGGRGGSGGVDDGRPGLAYGSGGGGNGFVSATLSAAGAGAPGTIVIYEYL